MKNKYEIRGEVTTIFLNQKNGSILETILDTADLGRVKQFPNTWCAKWSPDTQSFYCYGMINLPFGQRINVQLHRWLVDCDTDVQVDHYNNDTLNNRRGNLRVATRSENHQNRAGAQRNSKSGIRGVCWCKRKKKWQALIKVGEKRKHLGYFSTIEDAEIVVKEARRIYMPFSKEAVSL